MASVPHTPSPLHTVTPALFVRDGRRALDLYAAAFGAEVLRVFTAGDAVVHAELRLGDSVLFLSDESLAMGVASPATLGGVTSSFTLFVADADAAFARAVAAGCAVVSPLEDAFTGHRSGVVRCPFGHRWILATHLREVPDAEIQAACDGWAASQEA